MLSEHLGCVDVRAGHPNVKSTAVLSSMDPLGGVSHIHSNQTLLCLIIYKTSMCSCIELPLLVWLLCTGYLVTTGPWGTSFWPTHTPPLRKLLPSSGVFIIFKILQYNNWLQFLIVSSSSLIFSDTFKARIPPSPRVSPIWSRASTGQIRVSALLNFHGLTPHRNTLSHLPNEFF